MVKQEFEILVVDDEESLREICQDALEDAGYVVHQAENGEKALEFLAEKSVDLVVTDLRMPVMNGLELLKSAKESGIDSSFLIMTGFGTIETAVESMKMGASDYLPKPFNINHLLLKVEKVLQIRKARAERKKLSNVVRMLNLSNALNSQLELKSLINEFLFHIQKNFSPDGVVFFIARDDEEGLYPESVQGSILRNDETLLKDIAEKSQQVLIKGHSIKNIENSSYSMMIAPLINKMKRIGAVALVREKKKDVFDDAQLQLLSVFSSHTASSVENAALYGQMQNLTMQVIKSFASAVEAKDIYTRGHSDRVAHYATRLGYKLELSANELDSLYMAGVLHDIGKIGIPDKILNKPSSLTNEEYDVMKKHPEIGKNILAQVESLQDILPIIYNHHERYDGRGYPQGLKGNEIPFLAQVVSVVDSFEAMTSDRAYRNALSMEKVISIFEEGAGQQWNQELVDMWLSLLKSKGFSSTEEHVSREVLNFLKK